MPQNIHLEIAAQSDLSQAALVQVMGHRELQRTTDVQAIRIQRIQA